TAVFEGARGPLGDGTGHADNRISTRRPDDHLAAPPAHHEHNASQRSLPAPEHQTEYVVTVPEVFLNGNGTGTAGTTGSDDVIGFGGFGTGNGSHGPLGAPNYDPPPSGG